MENKVITLSFIDSKRFNEERESTSENCYFSAAFQTAPRKGETVELMDMTDIESNNYRFPDWIKNYNKFQAKALDLWSWATGISTSWKVNDVACSGPNTYILLILHDKDINADPATGLKNNR